VCRGYLDNLCKAVAEGVKVRREVLAMCRMPGSQCLIDCKAAVLDATLFCVVCPGANILRLELDGQL
jgi:hypothetical protein